MPERDQEILALESVLEALEPLDQSARDRVLEYVALRLGLDVAAMQPGPAVPERVPAAPDERHAEPVTDIRSLRESKKPRTANEMAAIVAYYLSEAAPTDEKKTEITRTDLEKYFKQAGHPLPGEIRFTLKNAASAGYFDSLGAGKYKLNPVGYNLVAHTLPSAEKRGSGGTRASSRSRSSTARKGGRKTGSKSPRREKKKR